MARLEARAIISAEDKTKGIFERIGSRLKAISRTSRAVEASAVSGIARRVDTNTRAMRTIERAQRVNSAMVTAGAGVKALGAGAAAFGAAGYAARAAQSFGDWDERLRRFQNTAEASREELGALEGRVRKVAQTLGMTSEDVFGGPEKLVAGGMKFDEALARTETLAKVAKAYGASTAELGDATLSMSQNLGITSGELPTAFDRLAKSTKQGQIEFGALAKFLPTLSARMASLGVKGLGAVDTIGAFSQAARKAAGSDEEAMNNIVNLLDKLADPGTAKALKKDFGFDLKKTFEDAKKQGKSFVDVMIDELDRLTKGDLFKTSEIFGDRQARMGSLSIIQNLQEVKRNLAEMRNAGGTVAKDLANVMAGPKAGVQQFKATIDDTSRSLLELAANALPAVEAMNRLLQLANEKAGAPGKAREVIDVVRPPVLYPGLNMPGSGETLEERRDRAFRPAPGSGGSRSRQAPQRATHGPSDRGGVARASREAAQEAQRRWEAARAAERTFVGSSGSFSIDDNFGRIHEAREHGKDLIGAARRRAREQGGMSVYDAHRRLEEISRRLPELTDRVRANSPDGGGRQLPSFRLVQEKAENEIRGLVAERERLQRAFDGAPPPSAEEIGTAVSRAIEGARKPAAPTAGGLPTLGPLPPVRPDGGFPGISPEQVDKLREVESIIEDISDKTIAPNVDASQVEGFKSTVSESSTAFAGLNTTVTPNVDATPLRTFIGLLDTAASKMAALDGQARSTLGTMQRAAAASAAARAPAASQQASGPSPRPHAPRTTFAEYEQYAFDSSVRPRRGRG